MPQSVRGRSDKDTKLGLRVCGHNHPMSHAPLLILVHSPLVGPSTWRPVAEALNGGGFPARTPSLLGLSGGPGPYAPRFAEAVVAKVETAVAAAVAEAGGRSEVILVGHSGAGAYLPAIAEAVDEALAATGSGRVTGAAFVDA